MIPPAIKTVRVDVPEFGENVFVRRWSKALKDRIFAVIGGQESVSFAGRIEIVLCSACDESGKLMLSESDRAWLEDYDCVVLDQIAEAAMELNTLPEKKSSTTNGSSSSA